MSTTIDQKIVEMRFDNRQFESGVQTSLGTIDRLKKGLKFEDSSKSLSKLGKAAEKVDMSVLSKSVETVRSRFSALEVMGVTALANITNSAVNAGKRITAALTIDPVKTGFNEYELKMDSVKTIMASTGEELAVVNKYLEELNTYSDQTIYSFADMTQNIGKFTNAGVKLEDAVLAIKGISNEAALSGANANEASRAMYNFAQALSVGYIQRIDWKSIELANMATVEFKEQLLNSAIAMGTVTKTADGMYATIGKPDQAYNAAAMFTETLDEQWLTTEVLINTLKDYSDETTDIGKRAYAAAQDVTKLTQMFDILKETAQSGWSKTWEIVFGDIETAKALFTPLTEFFQNIIDGMSDARNELLEGALGKSFRGLSKVISGISEPIVKSSEAISETVESLKNYTVVVDEILNGAWGNGQERWDALTKAGYDWAHAQNLVNEKLGDSTRHATDYVEAQNGVTEAQEKGVEVTKESKEANADFIVGLIKMSDEQLKAAGYTDKQIAALRELEKQSKKTGIPLKEFILNLDQINGRYLLMNGLKNIGQSIYKVFSSIGTAWREIFPPMSSETLYNIIAGFHKLSTKMVMSEETVDKLTRTFKGLFASLDIILTLTGGPLKIAFKLLLKVLKAFDVDILDITASIGDAVVGFRDWIDATIDFDKAFEVVSDVLGEAFKSFKNWIKEIKKSDNIPLAIMKSVGDGFAKAFKFIGNKISNFAKFIGGSIEKLFGIDLPSFDRFVQVGKDMIAGLVNGLREGTAKVVDKVVSLGKTILAKIKGVLGIHSPSREFFQIAKDCIAGFLNGLKDSIVGIFRFLGFLGKNIIKGIKTGISEGLPMLWEFIKTLGSKIIGFVKQLDLGKVLALAIGVSTVFVFGKLLGAINKITNPLAGFSDVCDALSDTLQAFKNRVKAQIIKDIAISIAILAGSVALLAMLPITKVWSSVGAIAALAVVLGGLTWAIGKFGPKEAKDFLRFAISMSSIGAALLLISGALRILQGLKWDELIPGAVMLGSLMVAMIVTLKLMKGFNTGLTKFTKTGKSVTYEKAKVSFISLAISLGILAFVCKTVAEIDDTTDPKIWWKLGGVLTALCGAMILMGVASRIAGPAAGKFGGSMLKLAIAIGLLMFVINAIKDVVYTVEQEANIENNLTRIIGIIGTIAVIFGLVSLFSKDISRFGTAMMGIAAVMGVLVLTLKVLSGVEPENLDRAMYAMEQISAVVMGLMIVAGVSARIGTPEKLTGTLIGIAVAIGVIGGICVLFGMVDQSVLEQGLKAVGAFAAIVGSLMVLSHFTGSMGSIIALTAAIAVIVGSIVLLARYEPEQLIAPCIAIGSMLLAFGTSMAIMNGFSKYKKIPTSTIVAMASGLVIIAGSLALLSAFPWQNVIASAVALGGLLLVITKVIMPSLLNIEKKEKTLNKGIMALLKIAVPLAAFAAIIGLLSLSDNVISTAITLAAFMLAMEGVLAILGIMAPLAIAAQPAVWSLTALAVPLAAFALVIGGLSLADNVVTTATTLGIFLAAMVGVLVVLGLISGLAVGALIGIGLLTAMWVPLSAFVNVISQMSEIENADKNATALAKLLGALTPFITAISVLGPLIAIGIAFTGDLGKLGTDIRSFVTNLGSFDESHVASAKCASEVLLALAAAATALPREGGIWGSLFGEKSISSFGDALPKLATDINSFISNLGTFGEGQVESVKCACDAIKALAEVAKSLPREGGFWDSIFGDDSLATFGKNLPSLGDNISKFVKSIGTFSSDSIESVKSATTIIKEVAKLGDTDLSDVGDGLTDLAKDLKKFAKGLGEFSNNMADVASGEIESAIDKIKKLVDLIKTTSGLKAGSSTGFVKTLQSIAKDAVDKFTKALSGSEPISKVEKAAEKLLKAFSDKVKDQKDKAKKAFKSVASDAADAAKSKEVYNDAKDAGKYLVEGFASGISANTFKAEAAAAAMAKAAKQAAEEALGIKSPSTEMMTDGMWTVMGFANGIMANLGKVRQSSIAMGKAALDSLRNTLGIHSPGLEHQELGKNSDEGYAKGTVDNIDIVEEASEALGEAVLDPLKDLPDKMADIADDGISGLVPDQDDIDAIYNSNKLLGEAAMKGYNSGMSSVPVSWSQDSGSIWASAAMLRGQQQFFETHFKDYKKELEKAGFDKNSGTYKLLEWLKDTDPTKLNDTGIKEYLSEIDRFEKQIRVVYGRNTLGLKTLNGVGNITLAEVEQAIANYNADVDKRNVGRKEAYKDPYFSMTAEAAYESIINRVLPITAEAREWARMSKDAANEAKDFKMENADKFSLNEALKEAWGELDPNDFDNYWDYVFSSYAKELPVLELGDNGYVVDGKYRSDMRLESLVKDWIITTGDQAKYLEEARVDNMSSVSYENSKEFAKVMITAAENWGREADKLKYIPGYKTEESSGEIADIGDVSELTKSTRYIDPNQAIFDQLEKDRKNGKASLIDELFTYKRMLESGAYDLTTEDGLNRYNEIADHITKLQSEFLKEYKDFYKDVEDLEKNHKQDVVDNVKEITDAYDEALKDRSDAIAKSYSLFEKVEKKEKVETKSLTEALESQLDSINNWDVNMTDLASKGVLNEKLINQLREMGPEAAAEIEALNNMSAGELAEYNWNWETIQSRSADIAKNELSNQVKMTEEEREKFEETLKDLASMTDAAGKNLIDNATIEKLREIGSFEIVDGVALGAQLNTTMDKLETEYSESLTKIREDWFEYMGITVDETTEDFSKMIDELMFMAGDQSEWNDTAANMVTGLIKGIEDNAPTLYQTWANVMTNMVNGIREQVEIRSPSRVFAEIGKFMDLGLVVGIKNYAGQVVSSTMDVGRQAVDAMSDVISRAADFATSDIDVQPTIRPVLDLSDIRSGSRTIGEMMSFGATSSVLSNVGDISSRMNRRRQNGGNDDIISELHKLGDKLGTTGNSYNINGITYDDGSNIANAVEALVRAAKIERRT